MKKIFILAACLFLGTATLSCAAEGLSTTFADVRIENVPRGMTFDVVGPTGQGLAIKNLGKSTVHVRLTAIEPAPQDLRGGAKAIPDVQWVRIVPEELDIRGRGEGRFKITLHVPPRWRYRHKLYQVTLWSRTEPVKGRGMTVSAGLLSRLRFKTQ